jgi:YCII-related domain
MRFVILGHSGARPRKTVPVHGFEGRQALRRSSGRVVVTDGPFAETKELLGGLGLSAAPDTDPAPEPTTNLCAVLAPQKTASSRMPGKSTARPLISRRGRF